MEWYYCPKCGQKIFRVRKNAIIQGLEIKCKRCKQVILIDMSR